MTDSLKTFSRFRISIFIFFIFQSTVFLTLRPLDRGDLNPALSAIGVVPMSMPYGDYKVIASAIQYYHAGGDPYSTGIFDFSGRKYNYLPFWLHFPSLGVDHEHIKYVYLVFASCFCLGLFLVFWKDNNPYWYAYLPFLFSPPVLLCLERCNYELLVFFVFVLGLWICRKSSEQLLSWLGGTLLLLATVLKVFPVFGFFIFVRDNWKRTFLFLVPFGILCAIYFAYSRPYIKLVHENTPFGQYLSFGINVIPQNVSQWILIESKILPVIMLAVAWIVAGAIILKGYYSGRSELQVEDRESYDVLLFRGASVLYITVFLMGSNFDYRLIFLLPTLPFIFRMWRENEGSRSTYSWYLGALLGAMWLTEANELWRSDDFLRSTMIIINELCAWVLLFICIALQFKLLPPFIRQIVYRESAPSTTG